MASGRTGRTTELPHRAADLARSSLGAVNARTTYVADASGAANGARTNERGVADGRRAFAIDDTEQAGVVRIDAGRSAQRPRVGRRSVVCAAVHARVRIYAAVNQRARFATSTDCGIAPLCIGTRAVERRSIANAVDAGCFCTA